MRFRMHVCMLIIGRSVGASPSPHIPTPKSISPHPLLTLPSSFPFKNRRTVTPPPCSALCLMCATITSPSPSPAPAASCCAWCATMVDRRRRTGGQYISICPIQSIELRSDSLTLAAALLPLLLLAAAAAPLPAATAAPDAAAGRCSSCC